MKIGILTSSRADYGIYVPLLKMLKSDAFFQLEIIAFGTHLSKSHGYTISEIEKENFSKVHKIASLISNDDQQSIATSYGLTVLKFADFWAQNQFDYVFCLGDRFEMSAAVQAGIPFEVKFAHLHGGETTLGAIDNVYRHQITLASTLHFVATDSFKEKIQELTGSSENIHSVGALSLDGFPEFVPIEKSTFYQKFDIPENDFALVTFHPETVSSKQNIEFAKVIKTALAELSKEIFIIITMPNADTLGSIFREAIIELKNDNPHRILLIENFGKENYFSAMYYSKLLIGNTSSGILEAASFGKYVINVGDRQKGRLQSQNTFNCPFDSNLIVNNFQRIGVLQPFTDENVYYKAGAASAIVNVLKNI